MDDEFQADIAAVQSIRSVPSILDVGTRSTGMGFAAVARVTADRWIACSVLDNIGFGLKPGGELAIETTLCQQVRATQAVIVIDHVDEDPVFCGHLSPARYGYQSYISVPIMLEKGEYFGALCAIDPRPARVNTPATIGMFKLFAEMIGSQLDWNRRDSRDVRVSAVRPAQDPNPLAALVDSTLLAYEAAKQLDDPNILGPLKSVLMLAAQRLAQGISPGSRGPKH